MDTFAIILIIIAALFYFLPTWIAMTRNPEHRSAIEFLNLLFGWTILGWIAALIWAIVESPHQRLRA